MISRRATFEQAPNPLSIALGARRRAGLPVLDLTVSNPTTAGLCAPPALLEALAGRESLVYEPEPFGLGRAREHVARELGVDPAQVVLTASTSEAYAHLLTLFCDPGDRVLVPRPSYPLIEVLARLSGVTVVPYDLIYDGTWHVDASTLVRDVKLVFAVSPNNPTGSLLCAEDLQALASLGAPVVIDEVFAGYIVEGTQSERAPREGLVISLGGLSKHALLPQLKLAWMVFEGAPARTHEAMEALAHVADAYLSLATPVQHALPAIFAHGRELRARGLARLRANLATLDAALEGTAISRLRVEGGFSVVLRLPAIRTEAEWTRALLDASVLTQPGHFYDFYETPRLVLSLLTPERELAEGVRLLVQTVQQALSAA